VGVDGVAIAVGEHPALSLSMPTAANSAVRIVFQPCRTVRVVSSTSMFRRAARVLPRVWCSS
jgi:hypothetical protein